MASLPFHKPASQLDPQGTSFIAACLADQPAGRPRMDLSARAWVHGRAGIGTRSAHASCVHSFDCGSSRDHVLGGGRDFIVSNFGLFANFRFTKAVSNINLLAIVVPSKLLLLLLLLPTLVFAVIQSGRLFRKLLQDRPLFAVRRLLPLAITAFLCSFLLAAFFAFVAHAQQQMWGMFREIHEAIENTQPGAGNLDAAHPLQVSLEDLNKAAPLSERTQRWLRNARISVAPDKPHLGGRYCCPGNSRGIPFAPNQAYSWYLATIHLPSGSDCTVSFQAGGRYGILGGVCR